MSENEDRDIDYSDGGNESYQEAQEILGDTDSNNDEHQSYVKSVSSEPNSDKVCGFCNIYSDYLIYGLLKGKPSFTCMRCLFNKILETGTQQFYNDSKEYKGMFFSYEDSFNMKS